MEHLLIRLLTTSATEDFALGRIREMIPGVLLFVSLLPPMPTALRNFGERIVAVKLPPRLEELLLRRYRLVGTQVRLAIGT